jgi:hypothetical protein
VNEKAALWGRLFLWGKTNQNLHDDFPWSCVRLDTQAVHGSRAWL